MFTSISNSRIEIVKNALKIDKPISSSIPPPLPGNRADPRAFAFALCGAAGSGKSTLLYSMLCEKGKHSRCYYKRFHHCYFIIPETSVRSMPEGHAMRSHPSNKIWHDFDIETLEEIMELVEENVANGERSVLVCDDIGSRLKQNRKLEKLFSFLLQTRRHRMLSFFITLQTFNDMSLSARKNISHCAMWRPTNRKETTSLWSELLPLNSQEEIDALFDFVYTAPHDFLYCKLYSGEMYRNFERIKKISTNNKQDAIKDGSTEAQAQGEGQEKGKGKNKEKGKA